MASDAAILILEAIKESSDALPPLKSAVSGVLILIDVIKVS